MSESWPPSLDELKLDLKTGPETRDDGRLQQVLDAAVAFVEEIHEGTYAFGDQLSALPEVPASVRLGVLRLAGRLHLRRRSPDGLVSNGDLGVARVATSDPDIERFLKIGRFRRSVIA
jgi:hypothetical protein